MVAKFRYFMRKKRPGEFGKDLDREDEIKERIRKYCSKKGGYIYKWVL